MKLKPKTNVNLMIQACNAFVLKNGSYDQKAAPICSVVTQEWELAENTKKPHYHNKSESESEWKRVRLEFSAVKYLWQ